MTARLSLCAAAVVLALAACAVQHHGRPAPLPDKPPPTKGIGGSDVRDSVYLPLERSSAPPPRYGLYTVLLTRVANRNSARLLEELFRSTGAAGEAALARENLNLVTIPVKSEAEAARLLVSARAEPKPAADALLRRAYDYGQASLLLASVCRPERGPDVMRICGSAAPDGPLLVTAQRALDGTVVPGERMLVVNLTTTPVEAVPEVMQTYRRQVMRRDFDNRDELDGWRLQALNQLITAAQLLPGISKAYAVAK